MIPPESNRWPEPLPEVPAPSAGGRLPLITPELVRASMDHLAEKLRRVFGGPPSDLVLR